MSKYSSENRRYLLALAIILLALNAFLAIAHLTQMPVLIRVRFLWFLATLAEVVAAAYMSLEACHPDNRDNRLAQFLAFVFGSVAIHGLTALFAQSVDPPKVIYYGLVFQCIYWSGVYTMAYAILLYSLYTRGIINGRKTKSKK